MIHRASAMKLISLFICDISLLLIINEELLE